MRIAHLGLLAGLLGLLTVALPLSGCGYAFQGTRSPVLQKMGIHRVFIGAIANDTLKPGVDTLVYNELNRVIAANKRVVIVQKIEDADAVLTGRVTTAQYARGSLTSTASVFPLPDKFPWVPRPSDSAVVATSYNASISTTFTLVDAVNNKQIWSAGFGRDHAFPGNNQLGGFGTTAGLINESEFDRALSEMVRNMMVDVHESMLAMF